MGLVSPGAVAWLSETAPEPDDPPPQATRNADNIQRQAIPTDACVNRFRTKAEALGRRQKYEERNFILEYTSIVSSKAHAAYS